MKRETQNSGVFTRRALIVGGVQVAALGALAARLYQVQVVEGARYATLADSNRISARLLAPPRGRLLDRNGVVVAGNRLNWRALLIAEQTADVGATLDNFARVVMLADHDRARIERDLRRHRRFIPVILREFLTWEDMARIEVHAPDLPGVLVDVGTTRVENRDEIARIFRHSAEKLAAFDRRGGLLVGDVHPLDVAEKAAAYTPVPGGVGPLTVAILMRNTVLAAKKQMNRR